MIEPPVVRGAAALGTAPSSHRRSNRLVIGIIAGFGIMFLLCAGVVGAVLVQEKSKKSQVAEYAEREPTGGRLGSQVVQRHNQAAPTDLSLLVGLEDFIDQVRVADADEEDLVDLSRAVIEMENSGLAEGVNFLTRRLWVENLRGVFDLPRLQESHEAIEYEWLVKDRELRVTLATYSQWDEKPSLVVLYLTHDAGRWLLYDFRDLAEALSQAQYFALYSAAPLGLDENYSELSERLAAIYSESYADSAEAARRSLEEYRKLKYPDSLLPNVQDMVGSYLEIYESVPEFQSLLKGVDDSKFGYAHYYRAKLAILEDDKPSAFRCAQRMVRAMGWHPIAANIAGYAAENDEQKSLAGKWLVRSLSIMPDYEVAAKYLSKVATSANYKDLIAAVSRAYDSRERVVRLVDNFAVVDHSQLPAISIALRELGERQEFVDYCDLMFAWREGNDSECLRLALKLLSPEHVRLLEVQPDKDGLNLEDSVWQKLVRAAMNARVVAEIAREVPDRERFIRLVRDAMLSYGGTEDHEGVLSVLDLSEEPSFRESDTTNVVRALCLQALGRTEESVAIAEPIVERRRSVLADAEESDVNYQLLRTCGKNALQLGSFPDLANSIGDAELTLVVLARLLEESEQAESTAKLAEILEWYRGLEGGPRVWLLYFESQLAFVDGDWEKADAALEQAAEIAATDSRFAVEGFPRIFSYFATIPEFEPAWIEERIEIAGRMGCLPALITKLKDRPESLVENLSDIYWTLKGTEDVTQMEDAVEALREIDGPEVTQVSLALQVQAADLRGEFAKAAELIARLLEFEQENDSRYYGDFDAIALLDALGATTGVDRLSELAVEKDDYKTTMLLATLKGNNEVAFFEMLKHFEYSHRAETWFSSFRGLLSLRNAGFDITKHPEFPIDVELLASRHTTNAVLVLTEPASKHFESIQPVLQKWIPEIERLPLTSFPAAVAGWKAELPWGRLLMVAYDELPNSEDHAGLGRLTDYKGLLCVNFVPSSLAASQSSTVRELCANLGAEIPTCVGYIDQIGDSWFLDSNCRGQRWYEQLRNSLQHGVNRYAPKLSKVYWNSDSSAEQPSSRLDGDDTKTTRQLVMGQIVEELSLKAVDSIERVYESEYGVENELSYEMLQDCELLPFIKAGTRIYFSDY